MLDMVLNGNRKLLESIKSSINGKSFSAGLSPSSLEMYSDCPYRFALQKIQKVASLPSALMGIGSFFHYWKEMLVKELIKRNCAWDRELAELLIYKCLYKFSWNGQPEYLFRSESDYKDAISLCYKDLDRGGSIEPLLAAKTVYVEEGIAYDEKWDETKWVGNLAKWRIKMDLAYIRDGVGVIQDYKTGWKRKSSVELLSDIQAQSYALALFMRHSEIKKVTVIFDFPRYGELSSCDFFPQDVDKIKKNISELCQYIYSKHEWPSKAAADTCKNCDVRYSCFDFAAKWPMNEIIAPDGINSEEEATVVAEKYRNWQIIMTDIQTALREYCKRVNGVIPVGEDWFGAVPTSTKTISGDNWKKVVSLLIAKVNKEPYTDGDKVVDGLTHLSKYLTISASNLEKLCTKKSGLKDFYEKILAGFADEDVVLTYKFQKKG